MPTKGVNRAHVLGNLGADPEVRYTPSGNAVANLRVATSEFWTDRETGEQQERTEWHRIVFFNRTAEVAREYLRKGSKVYVSGKLQTRKWQDQQGNDRYTTEIVGDDLQLIDSRGGGQREADQEREYGHAAQGQPAQQTTTDPGQQSEDFDDDIPF